MKKINLSIAGAMLSLTAFANTGDGKTPSIKDTLLKKAYEVTNNVKGEYKTIGPSEVKEMLDKGEATLLDVRNPDEIKADGYIKDSVLIPLPELEGRMGELDKEKTYITFCAVGGRSQKAAALLSNNGFTKIYNAKEGMKTWPYEKIND